MRHVYPFDQHMLPTKCLCDRDFGMDDDGGVAEGCGCHCFEPAFSV
jgi:hypothetical protein